MKARRSSSVLPLRMMIIHQHYLKPLFTFCQDHPVTTYLFLDSPPQWNGNKHFAHVYLNTWRCFLKAKKLRKKGKYPFPPVFLFLSFSLAPPSSNVCQKVLVNIPSKHSGTNSLCLCSFLSPCGFSVCGPHAVYLMLTFSCKWQKPIETIQSHSQTLNRIIHFAKQRYQRLTEGNIPVIIHKGVVHKPKLHQPALWCTSATGTVGKKWQTPFWYAVI